MAWLASLAGSLFSTYLSSSANKKASKIAGQARQEQTASLERANALAQQRYEDAQAQAQPAVAVLRRTAAQDPNQLSSTQQRTVDDARRQALNAVNAGGMRGSGRATIATIKQTEQNTTDRLVEQNRQDRNSAASSLSGQYFNAGTQAANTGLAAAQQIGQVGTDQAMTKGNAETSNARLYGSALADIVSATNEALKSGRKQQTGTVGSATGP